LIKNKMGKINNLKIKNKLIAIILLVTAFTLVIASASIIVIERRTRLNSLHDEISIAAKLTSNNLIGPLTFGTNKEINNTLSYLREVSTIKNGCVYDDEDQLRATYTESDSYKIKPPTIIKNQSIKTEGKFIHVFEPVVFKEKRHGTLYLRASTEEMDKEIERFIYFMILLFLVLIVLSILLANKLQGIISKPVLNLVNASKKVSSEGNYSIRVRKKNNDEIGMLYDAFNEMMEQILNRDTERDRVESQLKSAQFFLSSVIESMPSLLVTIEESGKITQWNRSTTSITAIDTVDAIGKNLWELLPDFIEFRESIRMMSGEDTSLEFYKKLIKINGDPFYFNGSIFPLLDSNEPKFVIMLNNVTDLELKERQLRQSQKMETIGNLAGGLAHDFNNVLGGIIGTISLFKYKTSKNKEITRKEIEKYFNIMEDAANRASDMVQHLLSLTRKHDLSFTPTDLNEIIKNTVKICRNTFDKSIEIETTYSKERAMANADPTQIEQSLLNLCINSSHAMTIMRGDSRRYGGTLNISLKKMEVDKYFRHLHAEAEEPEYWDISVSDTGVGMDQKTVAHIFDPFFTTKSESTGTGLGLAMVYNIIKQHKGFLEVYSQEEIGTTFHIYLPILKYKVVEEEVKEKMEIPKGEGLILVVDDEEVIRQTAKSILMECGYTVLLAKNGADAVEIFKKHKNKIRAVLLDMVMPKMSGKQTYTKLAKIDKNVKVLLVSGFKQDHRVESILKLGVKSFIQKPFSLTTLANQMYRLINT